MVASYLLSFYFTCEALLRKGLLTTIFYITYSRICRGNLPREIAVAICRENLPQDFVVRIWHRNFAWLFPAQICRRNLPWKFAVTFCRGFFCICRQILFCVCDQILFIWKQTFFICEQNVFICEIFFINSVFFCYCRGSYEPLYLLILNVFCYNIFML